MNSKNAKERKKHIMEVIYCFDYGGSENLAAILAKHFRMEGYYVSVCATHTNKGPISNDLEQIGIPCYAMNSVNHSKIGIRYALYKLFKKNMVDILHIHHVPMFRLCYFPARLAGVEKIILTEHTDYEMKTNERYHKMGKKYGPLADMITVVHNGLNQYFRNELNVNNEKILTIYNGVDTQLFRPDIIHNEFKKSLGIESKTITIGWIGRFHKDKDLKTLIHAFKLALQSYDKLALILVGEGEERSNIDILVKSEGIEDYVYFTGQRNDISYILNGIDIFALSSKTEGLPLVILEALSTGVPCVATNVGGVSEVMNESVGAIVPPGDIYEFSQAILKLAIDDNTRNKMGKVARKYVLENFDQINMFDMYKKVFS